MMDSVLGLPHRVFHVRTMHLSELASCYTSPRHHAVRCRRRHSRSLPELNQTSEPELKLIILSVSFTYAENSETKIPMDPYSRACARGDEP